ncbi:MAG: hypothetical protein GW762_01825 [Candidatus Pacebacteria bacterium]|nr:hypothetical protein [Candidatus Paceibacterota bacterium]
MQPNGVSMDITTIELTSYRKSKESLLEQLIRTRKLSGAYSSEYLMLVHLFTTDGVDYEEIKKYANEKLIDYPIWAVRNVRNHPDTIAELVVVNPTTSVFEINVGKEAFEYDKKYDLPDIVFSKEVISPREVRTEETGESNIAPWQERQD